VKASPATAPSQPLDRQATSAASPSLQRAVGLSPAERLVNLAVTREGSGDLRSAIDVLKRALRLEPDLPEAHWNAAILLERTGETDGAATHWASYLELKPSGDHADEARRRLR